MAVSARKFARRVYIAVVAVLSLIYAGNLSSLSAQTTVPSALPGWTHGQELSRDTSERHGIILSGNDVTYSSPVIAEIDGNPDNGKEVAVGGADGVLYTFHADGSLLWSMTLPNFGCRFAGANNKLLSSPAVGDLFGNGIPAVVVGYGGVGGKACGGGVVAYRGSDGAQLWHLDLKKFDKRNRVYSISHSVFSSPALADTDADGTLEIGFGGFDRNVYLLNADGSLRWYYLAADTVWSSPAFANVDSDSQLEMIVGTDISANRQIRPPTINGGYLYAFKTTSRKGTRINFRDPTAFEWKVGFNQVIYSSPIIADVLPSSPGLEVIIGSGCFFPQRGDIKEGKWFKILRLSDGKLLQTLPTQACSSSQVAVGDIDEDGDLDIVATVSGVHGGDGFSRVVAWDPSNPTPLWSVIPRIRGKNDELGGNFISPLIADIDGNGSLEVVVPNGAGVAILEGKSGNHLSCGATDCAASAPLLQTWEKLFGTPAIGDIDGDGDLDVVAAGGHSSVSGHGAVYGWTNFSLLGMSQPGIHQPYSTPSPMYRGGSEHRALLP